MILKVLLEGGGCITFLVSSKKESLIPEIAEIAENRTKKKKLAVRCVR